MYWWKPLTDLRRTLQSAGDVVTINPTTILEYNTDYYVLAGNKTISDFTDNNWIGITLTTAWNFKTEPDPSVYYSRANGNWNNPGTWSHVGHTGPRRDHDTRNRNRCYHWKWQYRNVHW